ncbi:pyridoxamine 5'-phosphate oxidase family protein [Streptomyces rochei]|uniref:Pyridoxamine 5'-phosphate oxidase family protein n=1 Tax=Streptomyces rochei TaxID=1928 RepID=A0ABW7E2W0_STRRO|nr:MULTISPECIES: pyridoxamine 5'-phosphate oxidase family protein [Streptomyces]MDV6287050.1 pyridoxamine 5'-phosphate oxidase family protein [Streptomyces sp. UP1A-1]KYK14372.1 pyridoxamine 5'-phosphate oxidase [Streptomyces sp. CC71]MBJ6623459.1 pyridoxamine 5'-phosphate oxidase family protein [Streptomyces sp. DHE17-7]MBQ0914777.1 pyridoxamine 5'-phosphate oxidase family protein [Streptomyces sp. RM99]MBU8553985.1 pyridoxamine 5'-phosphate oxidase family protein [Streptomyces sp. Osf17]
MPSMPRPDAVTVPDSVQAFLTGTALVAAFTTMRPDGTPHVAPVRFTWDADAQLARVMTVRSSRKARNLLATPGAPVALCQVDGFRWVTLEGTGTVVTDPERVALGARLYAKRYWSAPPTPSDRVVIEIAVDRVLSLNA